MTFAERCMKGWGGTSEGLWFLRHYKCCVQVSMIMSEGISKTKMKASDFRFTGVRGWLGGDQTERIEGWKTYIYEAAGKMKAVNTIKVCTGLTMTWAGVHAIPSHGTTPPPKL